VVVKHTRASCELPLLDIVLWRALDDDPECPQCRTTRQAHERMVRDDLEGLGQPCLRDTLQASRTTCHGQSARLANKLLRKTLKLVTARPAKRTAVSGKCLPDVPLHRVYLAACERSQNA
jgi:hypothetical protein